MGLFDKLFEKKDTSLFQINDELETKGDFPERFIVKERKGAGANISYVIVNKSYAMDKKEVAEYELQRYYRLVNR